MRIFRMAIIVLFVVISGLYLAAHYINSVRQDLTVPQINYEAQVLEVSVNADTAELLRDVTASDAKDGDLTHKVIVEKISNFVEKGLSNITYAVVDADNHTVKVTRRIHYTDYRSPRFVFNRAMRFDAGSSFNVLAALGAVDMIDGDISDKIKLTGSDLNVTTPGVYQMQAQVTNSKGDVSYLRFNVTITPSQRGLPVIELSDYLLYLRSDERVDLEGLVSQVSFNGQPLDSYVLEVIPLEQPFTPGQHTIMYHVTDQAGRSGETELVIIVEE